MGIGARNNAARSPAPKGAPGQGQPPQQQPAPGQGYSNAPLPRGAGGNGQGAKSGQQQDRLYLCYPFVKAALVKGNFKTIVALPKCASTCDMTGGMLGGLC